MRYVIIGGDAAGMSAAMQIVRGDEEAQITVLEQGEYYSYAQCGLPYVLSGEVVSTDQLIARSRETFVEKYGIDARVHQRVTEIDPRAKQVRGQDLAADTTFTVPYDKLLLATGAEPRRLDVPGCDLDGVHYLKTIPDLHSLQARTAQARTVAVIGAGYVGLEAVEAFAHLGKKVHLIQRSSHLGANFDPDMSEHILEKASAAGVEVHLETQVREFRGSGSLEAIVTDTDEYPVQLALVAVGVVPATNFLPKKLLTGQGAVKVDAFMQTDLPHVYAAGDCAAQYHLVKNCLDYLPLGTTANKQGVLAGLNMLGQGRAFVGVVGTSILRFFDLTLARTGLSAKEAGAEDIPYEQVSISARQHAGYMPGTAPLHVKLIFHKNSRKLLGGQCIGPGADKRIDVLATALFSGLTVDALTELDLSYAPPYNSVWDPVQQAARRAGFRR